MKKSELINALEAIPEDVDVYLDDQEYGPLKVESVSLAREFTLYKSRDISLPAIILG